MFYETGKRKIQEDRKILARSIPAGERERAHVCRVVCPGNAGVCVVGNAGILNLRDYLKTEGLEDTKDKSFVSWCIYEFTPQFCGVVVSF
jgi:hypothetical protein